MKKKNFIYVWNRKGIAMHEVPFVVDSLAANGILDFDADAFVKGTRPRYAGRPREPYYPPFDRPLPYYPEPHMLPSHEMHEQPHHDELVKPGGNPSWKKQLAALLVAGLGIYAGFKHKEKITDLIAKVKPNFDKYIVEPFNKYVVPKWNALIK